MIQIAFTSLTPFQLPTRPISGVDLEAFGSGHAEHVLAYTEHRLSSRPEWKSHLDDFLFCFLFLAGCLTSRSTKKNWSNLSQPPHILAPIDDNVLGSCGCLTLFLPFQESCKKLLFC